MTITDRKTIKMWLDKVVPTNHILTVLFDNAFVDTVLEGEKLSQNIRGGESESNRIVAIELLELYGDMKKIYRNFRLTANITADRESDQKELLRKFLSRMSRIGVVLSATDKRNSLLSHVS